MPNDKPDESAEVSTKTTFWGNPVKDDAGEDVQEIKTSEGKTYESRTKTTFWGNPVKDDAGNPVKEIKRTS